MSRPIGPEGVEILPPDADETTWLAARTKGVGASEVAAVLGESKWQSPYGLWAAKTGKVAAEPRTAAQARGIDREAEVAEMFADRHPEYAVENVGLVQHRDRPWELATPDRLLLDAAHDDGDGLLEVKTAGSRSGWGSPGSSEIPVEYVMQCQWQMAVTGLPFVAVAALFVDGWEGYREYQVDRDEDVIAYLREQVEQFWTDHILADAAPPLDGHDATTRAIKAMLGVDGGIVELGDQLLELRARYWSEKDQAAKHETEAEKAANEARALLAGASAGTAHGVKIVSNTLVKSRETVDLRRLTADHPDLAEQYHTVGKPYTRLIFTREDGQR